MLKGVLNLFIYTVQPGDSLYRIGQKYRISIDQLRLVNGLNETNIVPGQAILIPLVNYTVQPGDSLFTIANMANVSVQNLQAANPAIKENLLQPGTTLRIPNISNYNATSLGYYTLRSPELDQALIQDFSPYITYVALFEYHMTSNGELNAVNDLPAIEAAWRSRVAPLVTITNLTETGFSSELTNKVLNNPIVRNRLINNIVHLVSSRGYIGVNIDLEGNLTKDRDIFSGFLRSLRDRLKPGGYRLTIAVPPKTNENVPWLRGYDYGAIGSVVDFMFIMAYDFHHSTSEPGPVAPLNDVKNTVQFALSRVSRKKIILGLPLYGYNWTLPYQSNAVYPGISNQDAIQLAMRYQVPIQYSKTFESPFFRYVDEQGAQHVVWFEDSRSISKKLQLIQQYRLEGVGAWQLTLGFSQGPWLLTNYFHIKKT